MSSSLSLCSSAGAPVGLTSKSPIIIGARNENRLRKTLMALTITAATFIPTQAMASSQYHGILPDAYYTGLARCETGINWQHSTKSYTGGLGIHRQTFRTWSNYNSAKGLTPRQQVKVADAIAFTGFTQRDGRHIWRVGPWGWGCLKAQASLQRFICASRHTLVVRWKRNCK